MTGRCAYLQSAIWLALSAAMAARGRRPIRADSVPLRALLDSGAADREYAADTEAVPSWSQQTCRSWLRRVGCLHQHGAEHWIKRTRRTGDDREHVGGGGLLLQQLAQLVEQPRVLYGDDGLRRKRFKKLALLSESGPGATRTTLIAPIAVLPRKSSA